MKKMMFSLIAMFAIAMQAGAMSYEQARNEALFLTDKMAYELNLSDAQYEAAYEINLDYLMSVTNRDNVFGTYWERRNHDLSCVLYAWQWSAFCAATYFYRPLYWNAGHWHFGIYARYPHRDHFYFGRPHFYISYRGGHSWHVNGGRSYYERNHNVYRPQVSRDRHLGMRDRKDHGNNGRHIPQAGRSSGHDRPQTGRQTTGGGNRPQTGHSSGGDNRPKAGRSSGSGHKSQTVSSSNGRNTPKATHPSGGRNTSHANGGTRSAGRHR